MANHILLFTLISIFQLGVISSHPIPNQDTSYMKFVHEASELQESEEYDYIIIGGGTAGCPLAATLSSKFSVLLLERGNDPNKYPSVLNEQGLLNAFVAEDDGQNPFQHFISEDGVENLRGRVLGGGSMINAGFYSRGHREFFETAGVDWDMELVEKAYEWVEETVVSKPSLSPWQAAFRSALLEGGVGHDNGFDLKHLVGTKTGGSIFDNKGNRHGAVELLNKGEPENFKVATQATVQRIIFTGLSASGVSYSDSKGKLHTAFIRKKGEIILSAGAIGSPQLLLLSGVGPKSQLKSLKLPVVLDQPHVGEFMSDNPRFTPTIVLPFQVVASSAQVVGTLDNNIHLQAFASPLPFFAPPSFSLLPPQSTSIVPSLAIFVGKFSDVYSEGSLRLNSSIDVKESPIVRFNYYSHPDDLARCVRGVRKVGDLLRTPTMEKIKTQDLEGNKRFQFLGLSLPENLLNDSAVEEYCQKTVTTYWHYHGGCLVGKVVDDNHKVIGIENLRVVDGSTFSVSPGTNPMATLMMLGRYVGLKVLQQRSS
ncbi:(R)-mandelonitrile lyase 1-like [Cucumis melo var. makuwa]|uniref:(R)-mandelonitrile lyase n=2 Tax=Cucumis melo TaxID=3656 RepID=A0A1S3BSP4_CUCME|nr:(R)-mandelonitrile lyase 1-like [Cucumis melo]KAA0067298.1 (R)-mandelonitrile lyase 1-like [Cucumis melo var. makuwa]TYK10909.1 (R)-mandelonitrile lyase 1-like [Cucumis melo var. makuwa]